MPPTGYKKTNGYDKSPLDAFRSLLAQPAVNWRGDNQYGDLLRDLQANILKHQDKEYSEYFFITFDSSQTNGVKNWLSRFSEHITSAEEQLRRGHNDKENILCIYLTYAGYKYLGIPDGIIPPGLAFKMGIANRVKLDKTQVQDEFSRAQSTQPVHAVIMYAYDKDHNDSDTIFASFMEELAKMDGKYFMLKGTIRNPLSPEYHFAEGIGNPRFFPGTTPYSGKKPFKPSEISALDLVLVRDNGGNQPFSSGSYGAFLKLKIDENAINTLIQDNKGKIAADMLKANIIGRFTDGTPLTLSDEPTGNATNDFDYTEMVKINQVNATQSDESGGRCPFHAHIRKANLRRPDTAKTRIVRRGVFYKENDSEKGLLFMSFQDSLENKFEFILNNWMLNRYTHYRDHNQELKEINSGADLLFSQAGDQYDIRPDWNANQEDKNRQPVKITIPAPMVVFKGGIYFFAPSKSFFSKLVRPAIATPKSATKPVLHEFLPGTELKIRPVPGFKTEAPFLPGTQVFLEPDRIDRT
ncbi:MAG: Dyp-type peroxidase [Saprospiraceae bacterium]|nr:Dyp-type peroxidase [Saprospiraceae bacterium]